MLEVEFAPTEVSRHEFGAPKRKRRDSNTGATGFA